MRIIKTNNKKYPLKIVLSSGRKITIPKQSEFDNQWLKHHGCSLMAEYVALQFLGVYKWPIHLLKWHKSHTPGDVRAKVTVKGVSKGINALAKGNGTAAYYTTPTAQRIRQALDKGYLVIMEQKNPIHSVTLIRDGKTDYIINYGSVKKVNVNSIAKTATGNETYRGMIIVRR